MWRDVTAWPVFRKESALRAYAFGIIIQRFQEVDKEKAGTKSKEGSGSSMLKKEDLRSPL